MKMQVASKDEIEINIDKIQPRTFHYLNNLVKSNLPEKKARYGSYARSAVLACDGLTFVCFNLSPHTRHTQTRWQQKEEGSRGGGRAGQEEGLRSGDDTV